jgi:hypothetical protein
MQKTVQIKEGLYYGKTYKGEFTLVKPYEVSSWSKRDGYVTVQTPEGRVLKLHVFARDVNTGFNPAAAKKTVSDLDREIAQRFEVYNTVVTGVIKGTIKSLIVSGAPGIGKTYILDERLRIAKGSGKINYSLLTGTASAIGLYFALYEHSKPGDVLVLDDLDAIFSDQEALNLLKGALDTGRPREITWMTNSSFLKENEIPRSFIFEGSVVFVSNLDFDKIVEKATKLSPHFAALISRCVYLDLGIHEQEEIMVRIKQVVEGTNIMSTLGVSKEYAGDILSWMDAHTGKLRNISIRTIIQLANFIRTDPTNWKSLAEVTMVRR